MRLFLLLLLQLPLFLAAQYKETDLAIAAGKDSLRGTLVEPTGAERYPLIILEAGSGPTDRNGNSPLGVSANSYRLLARELAKQQIATLLFDKRGIAASKGSMEKETDVRFDTYVQDLIKWTDKAATNKRVSSLILAGHSEGSLVAMLAASQTRANGYISISGPASSIDKVIEQQIASQPAVVRQQVDSFLQMLKEQKHIDSVPPYLYSLFRPSIQPYMQSWLKYTPCEEIKKLSVPVLVIQGSTDLQVSAEEGKSLAACNPKASLVLVEGMNHILKDAPLEKGANLATYKDASLPINARLVQAIADFVKKTNK